MRSRYHPLQFCLSTRLRVVPYKTEKEMFPEPLFLTVSKPSDLSDKLMSRHVGFDHRAGHFRPPSLVEGIAKLPVLQELRCFYLEPSSAGVAGAMIKAGGLIMEIDSEGT